MKTQNQIIGLVGFGIIGSSWGLAFLRKGFNICVFDPSIDQETLESVFFPRASEITHITDFSDKVTLVSDLRDLDVCDYVQESIVEDLANKRALFAALDEVLAPHTIVGSSTSALGMSDMADGLTSRDRFVVVHPATPPHALPVVEIVPAPFTAGWVVETVDALLTSIGQTTVTLSREVPGFAMNRLQASLLLSMLELVEDGIVTPEGADKLIRDGFGLRWALLGPFQGVHLNAPGGIADYFQRYAPMFDKFCPDGKKLSDFLTPRTKSALQDYCVANAPLADATALRSKRDAALLDLRSWRLGAL